MAAATHAFLPYPLPRANACEDEPLSRQTGAIPPRASLVARMRNAAQRDDASAESDAAVALARLCLTRGVHVADAVSLLLRALELAGDTDHREVRMEAAFQLAALGRHDEAAELLRAGTPTHDGDRLELGLAAGDAAVRAGDAAGAAVIYRELAVASLRDPRPLERLASIAAWSQTPVTAERASEAWLEAASRIVEGDAAFLDIARAFEIAPNHERAAFEFAAALARQERHEAADEVLREFAQASGTSLATAIHRIEQARARGSAAAAFGATLDAAAHGMSAEEATASLASLIDDSHLGLANDTPPAGARGLAAALVDATRMSAAPSRGDALCRLSEKLRGAPRAVTLTFASEAYGEAGNREAALKLARQACGLTKADARPRTVLIGLGGDDDATMGELEDCMGLIPPRASHYRTLGRKAARLGRHDLASPWLRRALALRPGDSELRQRLLANLTSSVAALGPEAFGAALVALGSEPHPAAEVSPWLARAIAALAAHDPKRGAHVGRSLLQITGPLDDLVEEVIRAASSCAESRCALDVIVAHAVAGGTDAPDRWLRAVDAALGVDAEAAAAHLSQAAVSRSAATATRERLERIEANLAELSDEARADARIDLATARAWLAENNEGASEAAALWRQLGILRWDLASDVGGAEDALFYACARAPKSGVATYRDDLVERGGVDLALERIQARVILLDEVDDAILCAPLLAAAADLAGSTGRHELSVELVTAALRRIAPTTSELNSIDSEVERLAVNGAVDAAQSLVAGAYELLARRAAGPHGARAAYHRGARILQALGAHGQALEFAWCAMGASGKLGSTIALVERALEQLVTTGESIPKEEHLEAARLVAIAIPERVGRMPAITKVTPLVFEALGLRNPFDAKHRSDAPGLRLAKLAKAVPLAAAQPTTRRHSRVTSDIGGDRELGLGIALATALPAIEPTEWCLWERSAQLVLSDEERAFELTSNHRALANHLESRIASAPPPTRALLRLRRAALFETSLGEPDAACRELELILAESRIPDVDTSRQHARLLEGLGRHRESAERWERLSREASNIEESVHAAVHACENFLAAGDPSRAESSLAHLVSIPPTTDLILMRLAVSSALAGPDELDDDNGTLPGDPPAPESARPSNHESRGIPAGSHPPLHGADRVQRKLLSGAPSPDSLARGELDLFQGRLDDGEFAAGEELAAFFADDPVRFRGELIDVRRKQATLRRGNEASLADLLDAVRAGGDRWHGDAIEHVLAMFRGLPGPNPPRLEELPARTEATARLLFGHLEGTVNDALALACRAGLYRTADGAAALDGSDLVTPSSPSVLGRVFGSLQRLVPLEGVRLYHHRQRGPLGYRIELLSPVSAIVHGSADELSPALAFVLGNALAAATPQCAYVEALDSVELEQLIQGFLGAFGPVVSASSEPERVALAQLAQDLWSIVRGSEDRMLRELCYEPNRVAVGVARHGAGWARRRMGLFACGNLHTALIQTAAELDISTSLSLQHPDALRELCTHPSIANLVDLALEPSYAACRWRRATVAPPHNAMR